MQIGSSFFAAHPCPQDSNPTPLRHGIVTGVGELARAQGLTMAVSLYSEPMRLIPWAFNTSGRVTTPSSL